MEKMKVIFRREYDKYRKAWGYLAAFPEASANPGTILCLPFYFADSGRAIFAPHTEVNLNYYYNRKLVHAKTGEAEKCRDVVAQYYISLPDEGIELQVVEKIGRK